MNTPWRLVQISDLHLPAVAGEGYRGVDGEAQLARVLARILAQGRCDALLLSGDNVHHGDAAAYRRLVARLEATALPWDWIPGNHDDPRLMAALRSWSAPKVVPPGWQLLLLDSTDNADGYGAGSLTFESLSRLAAAATDPRPALVVLHHNPFATGSRWQDAIRLQNEERFWRLAADLAAGSLVLCGHLHQAWDLARDGVRLLSCPSTAVQFRPGTERLQLQTRGAQALPGYRWLELFDDGQVRTGVERVRLA